MRPRGREFRIALKIDGELVCRMDNLSFEFGRTSANRLAAAAAQSLVATSKIAVFRPLKTFFGTFSLAAPSGQTVRFSEPGHKTKLEERRI